MRIVIAIISIATVLFAVEIPAQDLRTAVRDGDVARVRSLLESGSDVNQKYENGLTSIYFAEKLEIVELLIAHGAKFDLRDSARIQSPIEHFADRFDSDKKDSEKWKKLVERLRKGGAEYTVDAAIYMNDVEFIRAKLDADDSWVNDRKQAQSVPLLVAARSGRVEVCALLLEHHADPDSFEECSGFSIMKYAVEHPAIIKLLIDHGANLRRRLTWHGGRSGVWIIGDEASILHHVVAAGNPKSVKLLLDAGMDATAADVDGQTPLHAAVRCEQFNSAYEDDSAVKEQMTFAFAEIIKLLLDKDASLAFINKKGQTPLKLAEKLESPRSIIDLLKRNVK